MNPGSPPGQPLPPGVSLRRALSLRCPACGGGRTFDGLFRMRPFCDDCGYRYEREPGYFLGALYFNYGATVGIFIVGWILLSLLFGLSTAALLAIWLPFAAVFPVWFFRYSRALWMALDLMVSPPEPEDFMDRPLKRPPGPTYH